MGWARMKHSTMKTIIFGCLIFSFATLSHADGIRWIESYAQGRVLAAQSNRLLLVHFGAEWCGPCKRMEANVFPDAELGKYVSENYVAVKIDVDQDSQTARELEVRRFPTDLILSPQGKIVSRLEGYQELGKYRAHLAGVRTTYGPKAKAQPRQSEKDE